MHQVPGTEGYGRRVDDFISVSQGLSFEVVCADFLAFLPDPPGQVLDVGSGAGQNAAALAAMGHRVVAAEPLHAFREAARAAYHRHDVVWLDDSLPELAGLSSEDLPFDFILAEGVLHHLTGMERERSLRRFSELLRVGGKCALSLRHGPPGLGTRVYAIDTERTVEDAERTGFACRFLKTDQPSLLPGKSSVTWSRLVLEKVG